MDFGSGSWKIEGRDRPVAAWTDGEQAAGILELDASCVIRLEDFEAEAMQVRLQGEDGFSVTLIPENGNECSIGRYEQENCVLPEGRLQFLVEPRRQEPGGDGGPISDAPHDRDSDFDILPGPADGEGPCLTARVIVGRMTEAQRTYFTGLPEEELARIIENVGGIVETARPGKTDGETEELLEKLARRHGFASAKEGRLFPITFEGHQTIGFPVRVTVVLDPGDLDGGSDIYVYHQRAEGEIEPLGKAEYDTYEDGSIRTLSFYTTGFSTFFTAGTELTLDPDGEVGVPLHPFPTVPVILAGVCVAAVAAAVILLIRRKRKDRAA